MNEIIDRENTVGYVASVHQPWSTVGLQVLCSCGEVFNDVITWASHSDTEPER